MYVIDASVFVSNVQPLERFHTDSVALLKQIAVNSWTIFVPAILFAEVGATIARNTSDSQLAQQVTTLLYRLPHLKIIPIDETFALNIANLAAIHRVRGCDATYVATALTMGSRLITWDKEQLQRSPAQVLASTPTDELQRLSSAAT